MRAISINVALWKWMQRKNIPEENMFLDLLQHFPDNTRCSLPNQWPKCRPVHFYTPSPDVVRKPAIVSQRQTCASSTAMAQIATYPDSINIHISRCDQYFMKNCSANLWRLWLVILLAPLNIWIKGIGKFQFPHRRDKTVRVIDQHHSPDPAETIVSST